MPKKSKLGTPRKACDRCRRRKISCIPYISSSNHITMCQSCFKQGTVMECKIDEKSYKDFFMEDNRMIILKNNEGNHQGNHEDLQEFFSKFHQLESFLQFQLYSLVTPLEIDNIIKNEWYNTKSWMYNVVYFSIMTRQWPRLSILTSSMIIGSLGTIPHKPTVEVDRILLNTLHSTLLSTIKHVFLTTYHQKDEIVPLQVLLECFMALYKSGHGTDLKNHLYIRSKLKNYGILHTLAQGILYKYRFMEMDLFDLEYPNSYLEQLNSQEMVIWKDMLRRFIWITIQNEITWYQTISEPLRIPYKILVRLNVPMADYLTKETTLPTIIETPSIEWILFDSNNPKRIQGLQRLNHIDDTFVSSIVCITKIICAGVSTITSPESKSSQFDLYPISIPENPNQSSNLTKIQFWRDLVQDILSIIPQELDSENSIEELWNFTMRKWGGFSSVTFFHSLIQLYDVKMRLSVWIPGMEIIDEFITLSDTVSKESMELMSKPKPIPLKRIPSPNIHLEDSVGCVHVMKDIPLENVLEDLIHLSKYLGVLSHGCKLNKNLQLGHVALSIGLRTLILHSTICNLLFHQGHDVLAKESEGDLTLCAEFLMELFSKTTDTPKWLEGLLKGMVVTEETIKGLYVLATQDIIQGVHDTCIFE